MGYQIEAFIEDGKPSLKIYDMALGELCLNWRFNGELDENQSQQEVHSLFRQLLLLTCKQDLRNVRVFRLSKSQHEEQNFAILNT